MLYLNKKGEMELTLACVYLDHALRLVHYMLSASIKIKQYQTFPEYLNPRTILRFTGITLIPINRSALYYHPQNVELDV